jgi:hypothetical protein
VRKLSIKKRYIEIVGEITVWSIKLTLWDRLRIGKFTRENVAMWLENRTRMDPGYYSGDFHAVCGDIDIPWATKEAFERYSRRNSG